MPAPKEIAVNAIKKILSEKGPDTEFSAESIWNDSEHKLEPAQMTEILKILCNEEYIEDTGKRTNDGNSGQGSDHTHVYRFGSKLKLDSRRGSPQISSVALSFSSDCNGVLRVQDLDCIRLCASLLSKRFLIATGLSGSGKTKLAQAFARWITPPLVASDPFVPGSRIQSERTTYYVNASDSLAVEFWNSDNEEGCTKVTLPRAIINEWAEYIRDNELSRETPARKIREAVKDYSKYSDQLHSFETHFKAAAFALLESQQQPGACYTLVPVGADWIGNENVMGYPNGLDHSGYITKPALDLILHANDNPEIPHFLILDEMNLSHVERYFADILSAIESDERIPLYRDAVRKANNRVIPNEIALPKNLFIIGTVNVDETTYMFSPKVLDRANVIEFRMDSEVLASFLETPAKPDISKLDGKGSIFGKDFVKAAKGPAIIPDEISEHFNAEMMLYFDVLHAFGAEFGYRVAYEAARFVHFYKLLGKYSANDTAWISGAIDCVIVQKFLPKLHGSQAKLGKLLKALWFLSTTPRNYSIDKQEIQGVAAKTREEAIEAPGLTDAKHIPSATIPSNAPYPISAEKIGRMWRLLNENGFTSFAEA